MSDANDDYFANKPEWFVGYATAVATYVVANDITSNNMTIKSSDIAEHAVICPIGAVHDVSMDVETETSYNTFGGQDYATAYTSVIFSCSCGKYKYEPVTTNSDITEIIMGILR